MTIIEKYISKQLIATILVSSLALLAIDIFFYLINELRFVGDGQYTISEAIKFIALTIPRKIYIMFPWAALVGTLLSLGAMAKNSELIAMRAAAISIQQISWAVIKAAGFLVILVALLGEVIAPKTEKLAQQLKTLAISSGKTICTASGTWVKTGNEFVHIGSVISPTELRDVTRFILSPVGKLEKVEFAKYAKLFENAEDYNWVLSDIIGTKINANNTETINLNQDTIKHLVDPEVLETTTIKHLERLSVQNLWSVMQSRFSNHLNATDYELAFWRKIINPFSILVMVLVAIPFAFGPLRSSSMGLKILVGIVVGFSFHVLNSLFAPLTLIVNLPCILAASIPTLIFFVLGCVGIQRVR
jgi:lipopolysaccharide export system permease protein